MRDNVIEKGLDKGRTSKVAFKGFSLRSDDPIVQSYLADFTPSGGGSGGYSEDDFR